MSDAFGRGCFQAEADLDRSRMIQRPRHVADGKIDLRERRYRVWAGWFRQREAGLTVRLHGGPYNNREALVNEGQRTAFVIGDYSYDRIVPGVWCWAYDDMA